METITIPSPTAFLASSPVQSPAKLSPTIASREIKTKAQKRKSVDSKVALDERETKAARETKPEERAKDGREGAGKKGALVMGLGDGVAKPKQSKSRNGCVTCKAKRLKCDETKPSCQQCHKRSVTCGGYKKDFKWRPFEETTFNNKTITTPVRTKRNSISQPLPAKAEQPARAESPAESEDSRVKDLDGDMQETFFNAAVPSPLQMPEPSFPDPFHSNIQFDMSTPPYLQTRETPRPRIFEPNSVTSSLESLFEDTSFLPSTGRTSLSGQSPRLIDLLLPGSEMNRPTDGMPILDEPYSFQTEMMHDSILGEDIEEIIRQPLPTSTAVWTPMQMPVSFSFSHSNTPMQEQQNPFTHLYAPLSVPAGSPEMLMLRFDKQTCGILSVKDGPTENPWRTLVWPLARDSPALYHAIASMTAFHTSKEKPALRVEGMEHMRRSIRTLASGIENMATDTALATTLVLAFSESWDQHISTGIEHLRGARILVQQALNKHRRRALQGDELARLKFLCNTWVYMDVIARLTSVDNSAPSDFDTILAPLYGAAGNNSTEIDPLMGCAATLFPLIGKAANLCRKVRGKDDEGNSIQIISQAIELKEKILAWRPGDAFETPEDPSSAIQHALQTAEAYRFATLLYLHQAVPEIPSLSSAALAKKVLIYLATVPLSSRLVIVQIYPLLAAGCEATEKEDREWVSERWKAMEQRMWIGNIEKCELVTQEVWRRRDNWWASKEIERVRKEGGRMAGRGVGGSFGFGMGGNVENNFDVLDGDGEMFSFEQMLNGTSSMGAPILKGVGMAPKNKGVSMGTGNVPGIIGKGKKVDEMGTEDMDPEFTVRGNLHWVGVMKDWEWEVLLG